MMRPFARSVLLAVIGSLFLLAARPSAAQRAKPKPQPQPVRVYTFDAQASEINIILTQEGLMSRRYPTHRVVAKSFNGKVELPSDETKLAAEVTAETKMLTNADTGMSEFERKEFHANLRGPILEADKFRARLFRIVRRFAFGKNQHPHVFPAAVREGTSPTDHLIGLFRVDSKSE